MLVNSGANLFDPESVKGVIVNKKWSNNTKFYACHIYKAFLESKGLSWETPHYGEHVKFLSFRLNLS